MSASCVVHAATLRGVQAVPVEVEVCVSNGMPGFSVVGMADASVQESRERVRHETSRIAKVLNLVTDKFLPLHFLTPVP